MLSIYFISIYLFLIGIFVENGNCSQCLQLEEGDVSGFHTKKIEGRYDLVLGFEDAWPDIKLNCNKAAFLQHAHPEGGVNVAILLIDNTDKFSVIDTVRPRFNSSTDIYGVQIDTYDRVLKKWVDIHYKVLMSNEDLVVLSYCVNNEDVEEDTQFYVNVYRKDGSVKTVSEVRDMLPQSVKDRQELVALCDN